MKKFFLLFFISTSAFAVDFYSFILNDCKSFSGLVLNIEEKKITLLDFEKGLVEFKTSQVKTLLQYAFARPLIKEELFAKEKNDIFFEVWLSGKRTKADFLGLPISVVEDHVFFLDEAGELRVYNFSEIRRLDKTANEKILNWGVKPIYISPLSYSSGCKANEIQGKLSKPLKVMSSKVLLENHFSSQADLWKRFNLIKERIDYYAKPFIYSKDDAVRILISDSSRYDPRFPIGFVISSGDNFGFQGLMEFGAAFSKYTPNLFPNGMLKTDVKYHFFRGHFSGDLSGLAAGSSIANDHINEFENSSQSVSPSTLLLYNHIGLVGIDYKKWSFMFGSTYPALAIQYRRIRREAFTSKFAKTIFIQYEETKWNAYGSFTFIDDKVRGSDVKRYLNTEYGATPPTSFEQNHKIIRFGGGYSLPHGWDILGSLLISKSEYKETSIPVDTLETQQLIYLQRKIGQYVKLGIFYLRSLNETEWDDNEKHKLKDTNLGGSFEFLF